MFEKLKSQYNPNSKISFQELQDLKLLVFQFVDKDEKTIDTSNLKIDKATLDFGLEIQKNQIKAKDELEKFLVKKFYSASDSDLNSLEDYSEYYELVEQVLKDNKKLIAFLKVNSLMGTNKQ
jgi:hypothetical protein